MTLAEVANALGVHRQAVSRWERGERQPDIEVMERWARIIGAELDVVLREPREGGEVELTDDQSALLARLARDVADLSPRQVAVLQSALDLVLDGE